MTFFFFYLPSFCENEKEKKNVTGVEECRQIYFADAFPDYFSFSYISVLWQRKDDGKS